MMLAYCCNRLPSVEEAWVSDIYASPTSPGRLESESTSSGSDFFTCRVKCANEKMRDSTENQSLFQQ